MQISCVVRAFVFTTQIVLSLYLLNPRFQASGHPLWLYSPVVSNLVGNPEDRFSHDAAQLRLKTGPLGCRD